MAGDIMNKQRYYKKSLNYYLKIIELVKENSYLQCAFIHQGIKHYGTYYNIALAYYHLRDFARSRYYLQLSIRHNHKFLPALNLLKKINGFAGF